MIDENKPEGEAQDINQDVENKEINAPVEETKPEDGALSALEEGLKAASAPKEVIEEVKEEPKAEEVEEKEESAQEPQDAESEAASLGVKNERARQRFVELRTQVDRIPELEKRLEEFEAKAQRGEELVRYVTDTGCNEQQFSSMLGYLNAINKGGPTEWAIAREALAKELSWLDEKLGKRGPGGKDLLEVHADLREAMEAGEITRERAEELASLRGFQHATQNHRQTLEEQTRQNQALYQQGVESLNRLEQSLRARDPNYDQKREIALEKFRARIGSLHPSEWATEFMLDYQGVQLAPPEPPKKAPVGHVPLRSQGGGGGLGKVASTPLEALEMGLAAAARGETP